MARGKKVVKGLSLEEKLQQTLVPVEEQPYPIPENWCYFYFTSLIDIEGGTQPPKSQFVDTCKDGYIRLVQIRDFATDKYTVYVPDTPKMRHFNENDIMIARYGASLGRICTGLKGVYNVALAKTIFSNDTLYRRYVYWMLQSESFQAPLMRISRTAQAGFNKDDLSNFAMPLPPYAEQHRIVDRIESLFAKLDEGKEKVQAVVDGFELRKSAILHKAFTGELTERWRKEHRISMDNWKYKKLSDVATVISGYAFSSDNFDECNNIPCIKITNVGVGNYISENYEYLPAKFLDTYNRFKVSPGDILISLTRSYIAAGLKVCICNEPRDSLLNQRVALIKNCNTRYIYYYLRSSAVLYYVKEKSKTTNQPNLSIKDLNNLLVPIPAESEQNEIVSVLNNLLDKEEYAKSAAEAVLAQIDTMKKAILARAFRGELGTNDPAEESSIELLQSVL